MDKSKERKKAKATYHQKEKPNSLTRIHRNCLRRLDTPNEKNTLLLNSQVIFPIARINNFAILPWLYVIRGLEKIAYLKEERILLTGMEVPSCFYWNAVCNNLAPEKWTRIRRDEFQTLLLLYLRSWRRSKEVLVEVLGGVFFASRSVCWVSRR